MTKTRTPGNRTPISMSPVAPPEITEPSPATLDATEPAEPSSATAPPIPTDTTENPNATGPPPERSAAPPFPVVGIGASAGGLAAFEAFFSAIPRDIQTGMAFVLVQHLAPDHKSILTELVKRSTRMQVREVADGMRVEPVRRAGLRVKTDGDFSRFDLTVRPEQTHLDGSLLTDFYLIVLEAAAAITPEAEERLPTPDAPSPRALAPEEVERLIHELRVHCTWCSTTP